MIRIVSIVFFSCAAAAFAGWPIAIASVQALSGDVRFAGFALCFAIAFFCALSLTLVWRWGRVPLVALGIIFLSFLAKWLFDSSGEVVIRWLGYEVVLSVFSLAILAFIVFLLLRAALSLLARIVDWPDWWRQWRARRRQEKGYRALSRGMSAVAAGDKRAALKYSRQAELGLDEPALTRLLGAQTAQMSGDEIRAERYFSAMLQSPQTEFLGLRGLIAQAMRQGRQETALTHARRARNITPNSIWVLQTLFSLHISLGDWEDAFSLLRDPVLKKDLGKKTTIRYQAILQLLLARQLHAQNDQQAALQATRAALKLLPGFVPAAILAQDLYRQQGDFRASEKILKTSWQKEPHPHIGVLFYELLEEQKKLPKANRKRLAKKRDQFLAIAPQHQETALLCAQIAIGEGDWAKARQALAPWAGVLGEEDIPQLRVCMLMAALEKGEAAQKGQIRPWLLRALRAPPGPAWRCGHCSLVTDHWVGRCSNCQNFALCEWGAPPETSLRADFAVRKMLPLLESAAHLPVDEGEKPAVSSVLAQEEQTVKQEEQTVKLATKTGSASDTQLPEKIRKIEGSPIGEEDSAP